MFAINISYPGNKHFTEHIVYVLYSYIICKCIYLIYRIENVVSWSSMDVYKIPIILLPGILVYLTLFLLSLINICKDK